MASVLDRADNYHDLAGLNALREQRNSPEALKTACRQFESFFTRQLLKTMRESNEALADHELLDSQGSDYFRDMYDDQLAVSLSKSGGMGLADMIYAQITGERSAVTAQAGDKHALPSLRTDTARPLPSISATAPESPVDTKPAVDYPELGSLVMPPETAPEHSDGDARDWRRMAKDALKDFASLPSPVAFVKTIWPFAKKAAENLGISPRVLVAQAALETGWGRSLLPNAQGHSAKNLFNIKADPSWEGAKTSVSTMEFENGFAVKKRETFRAYDSIVDSLNDYVRLIKESPRYEKARAAADDGVKAYAKALQDAGYATDPEYAEKISKVFHSDTLEAAVKELMF